MMIERLCQGNDAALNDGAQAAQLLFRLHQESISDVLKNCEHGKYLNKLGFGSDLDVCSRVDSLKILPIVKDGRINRSKRTRRRSA